MPDDSPMDWWYERGFTAEASRHFEAYASGQRVWLPLHDTYDTRVGAQGWSPHADPKYKIVLQQGTSLRLTTFHMHKALASIKRMGHAVITEGTMDAVALWCCGIHNVVATFGVTPGFSDLRAIVMRRYCSKILIFADNDAAGREAALEGANAFKQLDGDARILVLNQDTGCKDADDVHQKFGKPELRRLIMKQTEDWVT